MLDSWLCRFQRVLMDPFIDAVRVKEFVTSTWNVVDAVFPNPVHLYPVGNVHVLATMLLL